MCVPWQAHSYAVKRVAVGTFITYYVLRKIKEMGVEQTKQSKAGIVDQGDQGVKLLTLR